MIECTKQEIDVQRIIKTEQNKRINRIFEQISGRSLLWFFSVSSQSETQKKLSSSLLFFPYRFRNGKNTNNTYIQLTGNASVPRCVNTIVNEKNVKRTDEMVKWKQISPFAINIPAHKSHSSAGFTHTFCATHLYNENAQTSTTQHHLSSCFAIICRGDLQLNLASFNRQRCFFFCRLTSIVSKFNSNEKHRIYSI